MDAFLDVSGIVVRAKQALNFKSDAELADYLGVSRATVSNWSARNSIDYPRLLEKLDGVDYNWLLTGKGSSELQANYRATGAAEGKVELLHTPRSREAFGERSVPLYDITAAANLKTLIDSKPQYVLGKIRIPNIPPCDGALYVSGDSMYPILKSGDIVGFKMLNNLASIIYGEIYLVSFIIDGDDYLSVKYVNHSDKEGYIKLVSYNTHHEPMDIPLKSINTMALVKFSVRRHVMV